MAAIVAINAVIVPAHLPPVVGHFPLTVRLQLLALRFALERGTDPDVAIERAWAADELWTIGAPGGPTAGS